MIETKYLCLGGPYHGTQMDILGDIVDGGRLDCPMPPEFLGPATYQRRDIDEAWVHITREAWEPVPT